MKARYIITQSDDTQIDPQYYFWMDSGEIQVKFTDDVKKATTFASVELAEKTREAIVKIMHSRRVYDCNIEVVIHPDDVKKGKPVEAPPPPPPEPPRVENTEVDTDSLKWKPCTPNCGLTFEVATVGNRAFYRYKEPDGTVAITLEDGKAVNGMYCKRQQELRNKAISEFEAKNGIRSS